MNSLADQFYLKAVGAYPHSLENVMESLRFALSYDNEHVGANHLMGRLYAEHLGDHDMAESCYKAAMASDPRAENVCLDYATLCVNMREFGKAEKLIDYAMNLKGVDMARIYHLTGMIMEVQGEYDAAIQHYTQAILESYNDECTKFMEAAVQRAVAKGKLKRKAFLR
jgi:tetratricopeptide (TPR) repeat protein